MSALLFALGALLLLVSLVDALWTTLALEGAGPISGRIAGWLWRGFLRIHQRFDTPNLLSASATTILLAVVFTWAAMMLAGWTLLFSADLGAVVNESTKAPADLLSRVYFVGYTLLTLGIGDYVPQGGWKLATVACSLHGLFELTIALSYLLPVLGAAVESRQVASTVSALGDTPQAILTNAWTGRGFGELGSVLTTLSSALVVHANAHKAYPVLHYFRSTDPRSAPPLRIAVLDEALTLLRHGVREDVRPEVPTLRVAREAVSTYLRILDAAYVARADEAPPPPDLAPLRAVGIPLDEGALREGLDGCEARRRLLLGLVSYDGWRWEDVTTRSEASREDDLLAMQGA